MVNLTVKDDDGDASSVTETITVRAKPSVSGGGGLAGGGGVWIVPSGEGQEAEEKPVVEEVAEEKQQGQPQQEKSEVQPPSAGEAGEQKEAQEEEQPAAEKQVPAESEAGGQPPAQEHIAKEEGEGSAGGVGGTLIPGMEAVAAVFAVGAATLIFRRS